MQVRFIVMNNVFQGALPIGKQYDLKGSTLGRTSGADAAKAGTVLKDLDLDIKLKLEEGWHDRCCSAPCRILTCVRSMKDCTLGQMSRACVGGPSTVLQRHAPAQWHTADTNQLSRRQRMHALRPGAGCEGDAALARRLMTQLAADCALLEELRVMDYSLLLGIHARSSGWTSSPHATDRASASPGSLPDLLQYSPLG